VKAFCKRAAVAHQLVNCLTEVFFTTALERAKALDEYMAVNRKPMGPLHGLPISLKDSFNVQGVQTTVGYVAFASRPPVEDNSVIVDTLLSLGAVLYVKTNIPQTMFTCDSDNQLFGRTLNPRNLSLTAGGSTGGEGALLAMGGSVLGVGTDIAGSLRIPTLANGLYGFKPTSGRIPFNGNTPPGRFGSPSPILPVIGPQAHSIRDLELFMRTVLSTKPWDRDPGCLPIPWRQDGQVEPRQLRFGALPEGEKGRSQPQSLRIGALPEDEKRPLQPQSVQNLGLFMKTVLSTKPWDRDPAALAIPMGGGGQLQPRRLRIGVLPEDERRPLHPVMDRTMTSAVKRLGAAGHECIMISPQQIPSLWESALLGWKFLLLDPRKTAAQHVADSGEPWVKSIAGVMPVELIGWDASMDNLFDMITERNGILSRYQDLMVKNNLDVILMPPYQTTAVPHDTFGFPMYTILANLLDWPAGTIPFEWANREQDWPLRRHYAMYKPPYNGDAIEGMPSGIQLMARPYQDETLLKIMGLVDAILKA
jgi:amidase